MLQKPWFSKPIFGHAAGSTKLDWPHCKQFQNWRLMTHSMKHHCVCVSLFFPKRKSTPVQEQRLQPEQTPDATSLLRLCCRASVSHSGRSTLDVASRAPRDEDRSYCFLVALLTFPNRKVSDGVGVDGVGAKFPFCSFLQFSPWPKIEGPSTATACKCAENT